MNCATVILRPAIDAAIGYRADVTSRDHGDPGDAPSVPPPLTAVANSVRPSAAEEARTIAASTNTGTLATLTADGDPWASFVTYGLLGGAPVLCVSNLAEHGRNLAGDPRASIAIVAPQRGVRPAGQRPRHAGRRRRATRTGDERDRRPRCAPVRRRGGEVLHRLQRLLAVGAAGAAGALGRRVRADGFGDRRGLRRGRARSGCAAVGGRDRPSQRRPRRRARRDGAGARRISGHHGGDLHRRRPVRPRPEGRSPTAAWPTPGSVTPHRSTRSTNCVRPPSSWRVGRGRA